MSTAAAARTPHYSELADKRFAESQLAGYSHFLPNWRRLAYHMPCVVCASARQKAMGEALLESVLAEFAQIRDSRGPLIGSLVFFLGRNRRVPHPNVAEIAPSQPHSSFATLGWGF